jgi:hypothetical protein
MNIVEKLIKITIWVVGGLVLVFCGWLLRGYKVRKDGKQ